MCCKSRQDCARKLIEKLPTVFLKFGPQVPTLHLLKHFRQTCSLQKVQHKYFPLLDQRQTGADLNIPQCTVKKSGKLTESTVTVFRPPRKQFLEIMENLNNTTMNSLKKLQCLHPQYKDKTRSYTETF